MKQTDIRNFRDSFHRFYRQTANLNLYIQNVKKVDSLRVDTEIKRLSDQLEKLSNTPPQRPENFLSSDD